MNKQQQSINALNTAIIDFENLNRRFLVKSLALKSLAAGGLIAASVALVSGVYDSPLALPLFLLGMYLCWNTGIQTHRDLTEITKSYPDKLSFTFELFHSIDMSEVEHHAYGARMQQLTTAKFGFFK